MRNEEMIDDTGSVWELIERRTAATPDRVMLYDGDRVTTFAQYQELCERAAAGLLALGVRAGTNVSWQLPTWTESAVLVGALCRLGAVQNPMLPIYRYARCRSSPTDALQVVDHSVDVEQVRLRRVGGTGRGRERRHAHPRRRSLQSGRRPGHAASGAGHLRRSRAGPRALDLLHVGTTADPKGAQHTDRSVLAGAIGYAEKTHVVADDIALVAFPFTHVGGIIIGVYTPLLTGSAAVLMESWTAPASTELIGKHKITLANGAAAIHTALLEEARVNPAAYSTVRDFPSGGSTKPPHLHDELKKVIPSSIGTTSRLRHDRGADRRPDRYRRARHLQAMAEGTPTRGVTMKILETVRSR